MWNLTRGFDCLPRFSVIAIKDACSNVRKILRDPKDFADSPRNSWRSILLSFTSPCLFLEICFHQPMS
mgnify:CR=1 FL=1